MTTACQRSTPAQNTASRTIPVGAGPEDMVLDTFSGTPRLLISCHDRRRETDTEDGYGGFWVLDLAFGGSREMPRVGEPAWLPIKPHGIDIIPDTDAVRLYAISHDDREDIHRILVYRLEADRLVYEGFLADDLLNSPNAVCALPYGDLLVTNDSGKRGSRTEALFKRRRSTVVHYRASTQTWSVAATELAYANGITYRDGFVYVATTRQNQVFRYGLSAEGQLTQQESIATVKGGDNLRWYGESLLIPGHSNILAFVRHAGNAAKASPVQVWRLDAQGEGRPELLFADKGKTISGASTALVWGDTLYVSQVFQPFVLAVPLLEGGWE